LIALTILTLLVCGVTVSDMYLHDVCEQIIKKTESGYPSDALEIFKENELLLKNSVDNGYVIEARISLESLIAAYELEDEYEIERYKKDIRIRVKRVQKALFI
jgi:hypothetical protein